MEMDPATALVLFFIPVVLLFLWQRRARSSHMFPPSPPAIPIIGHLHLLSSGMPHHALARLSSELGPLLHLRLGSVRALVVASPRLAREVLKTHDAALASRPALLSAQYLSFGCSDVTFSPLGPYWRQTRRICVSELLSPRRVASFCPLRDQELHRLLSSISASVSKPIDMSARILRLANDVLCRTAFGKRMGEGTVGRLGEVLEEAQALFAGFCVGDFFPGLSWVSAVTGQKRRLERNLGELRKVCDEIIREHVGRGGGDGDGDEGEREREDFVDVLLRVQRSDDLEVPINDDNLKALVLDMFVAGTDTTAATIEWVMTELARNPHVMKKTQEEVRGVAGSKGKVEESHIQQLSFMKAVIKETLRLHPPVPLLVPRESIEACTIDGYEIPAKTRVFVNTYAIGRDPETWDNPLEFNPDRFENTQIDLKGQDFELLPFGGGRRGCPGYPFALATIETALSRMLYHFDWDLPPGIRPDDVDMGEIFGLATRKRAPLILVATESKGYEYKGVQGYSVE